MAQAGGLQETALGAREGLRAQAARGKPRALGGVLPLGQGSASKLSVWDLLYVGETFPL